MLELYDELEIYSKYGEDWADQVELICDQSSVDYFTCMSLRSTVDQGYAEMSIEQLNHMWQIGYSGEFDEYNEDFCDGGWENDAPEFPLDDIQHVVITNFYVEDDAYCKPET